MDKQFVVHTVQYYLALKGIKGLPNWLSGLECVLVTQRVQVQTLVGELRLHMLCGTVHKRRKRNITSFGIS